MASRGPSSHGPSGGFKHAGPGGAHYAPQQDYSVKSALSPAAASSEALRTRSVGAIRFGTMTGAQMSRASVMQGLFVCVCADLLQKQCMLPYRCHICSG